VAGGTHSSSFADARSTMLYDLDAANAVLALQIPPNDGTLVNVGALSVPFSGTAARRPWTLRAAPTAWCWRPCAPAPPARTRCTPCVLITGAATLFRNTTGDATRSLIGGSAGPSVLDMAIKL
jgi:hypothetical protein